MESKNCKRYVGTTVCHKFLNSSFLCCLLSRFNLHCLYELAWSYLIYKGQNKEKYLNTQSYILFFLFFYGTIVWCRVLISRCIFLHSCRESSTGFETFFSSWGMMIGHTPKLQPEWAGNFVARSCLLAFGESTLIL